MLMMINKNKIHRQIIKIILTVLSLIMIFTTLLLIFENEQRGTQRQSQLELCETLNLIQDDSILKELHHLSLFEQSISQHEAATSEEEYTFDVGQCRGLYQPVGA